VADSNRVRRSPGGGVVPQALSEESRRQRLTNSGSVRRKKAFGLLFIESLPKKYGFRLTI
jgi:hypothetical protein